jgi:acetolactate synthase-1/2/3 large subunit
LLEQYGVKTVFGIPGVHTLELYRGIAGSPIRHVTPRHEQAAGFMADAWSRVTGEPGVCMVISGPGVTNIATPTAQAFHDSRPVLVLSGVVPTTELGKGLGNIHDLPDQRGLMERITAFSHTILDPEELPDVLARAWEVFTARRPRPVHVEIPVDVLARATAALDRVPGTRRPPAPAPDQVRRAADLLVAAERPFLILGGGAVDAGEDAIALAEILDAPVGLSINAKGAVPDRHPLCLGATLGFAPVRDILQSADAVAVVGAELSDLDFWALDEPLHLARTVVRIDIDPGQLNRRIRPTLGLVGDSSATLRDIARHVRNAARKSGAAARVERARAELRWPPEVAVYRPLVDVLEDVLPEDRIIAGDSTQPVYAANHSMPAHRPRSWLMPIGYGTLGCALPMATGAKLAAPDRPVLCIAGDGGFLFTIQELATARDLGLALPVVLWNNRGYGEIRDSMRRADIPLVGTDASAHDFVAIAEGFGCHGQRAADLDDLRDLVAAALAADRPTVIEVRPDVLQ